MSHTSGKIPIIVTSNYENLIMEEPPRYRSNSLTHCYSSKYFWFAICHCILILLIVIAALTLCNFFGFTPVILRFFQASVRDAPFTTKSPFLSGDSAQESTESFTREDSAEVESTTITTADQSTATSIPLKLTTSTQALASKTSEQCPIDYTFFSYTNSCYKANASPVIFEDAESACRSDDAYLTSIHSEVENMFVVGLYQKAFAQATENNKLTSYSSWIGLLTRNESWVWLDGSQVTFMNFRTKLISLTERLLGYIGPAGLQWLATKADKNGFVCKKSLGANTSDQIKDPEPSPCRKGFDWIAATKSCYKVVLQKESFFDAKMKCSVDFSRLVSIHSEEEYLLVKGLVEKKLAAEGGLCCNNMWLGMEIHNKMAKWVDGSTVNYTSWDRNQPVAGNEHAVMSYHHQWRSSAGNNSYICKY